MSTLDSPYIEVGPRGVIRVAAFTLGTALAWLGHDCFGGCPRQVAQLRADTWHLPHGLQMDRASDARNPFSLVLVHFLDTSTTSAPHHSLLRKVNHCTWPNRIRVREWNPTPADALPVP